MKFQAIEKRFGDFSRIYRKFSLGKAYKIGDRHRHFFVLQLANNFPFGGAEFNVEAVGKFGGLRKKAAGNKTEYA